MHEPNPSTSRLAIAGGLAAALIVAGAGFLVGRSTMPREPAAKVAAPAPAPSPAPTILPQRLLARADLIRFADRAADALTAGTPLPAEVAGAAGQRFELVLPFGCDGSAPEDSRLPMRWRYDSEDETLRVHAEPTEWTPAEWGLGDAADLIVRGFWISRPWSSADRCPQGSGRPVPTGAQPVTLPGQTLALANFAAADPRRDDNRDDDDRAYATVQRIAADGFDPALGFRLRVTGRIDRVPGGATVACVQPAGPEQRPICVIAAVIDEVRIENPQSGEALATWNERPRGRDAE